MIDRVEIAQDADGTAEGAEEKIFLGSSIQPDCGAFLQEDKQGEKHCNEITEKLFWTEGKSPERWTNKFISAKEKEESRIQQTPLFFCDISRLPFFCMGGSGLRAAFAFLCLCFGEGTAAVILSIKMIFCG